MDKYDKAIKYLQKNPLEIPKAWESPKTHPAGCLFQFAKENKAVYPNMGCPTMIRGESGQAQTDSLTQRISNDIRIPTRPQHITLNNLYVFAEWQRIIDKELNRC